MPSYNYYEDVESEWLNRFPEWAVGYPEWRRQPPIDAWTGPSIYDWNPEGVEPRPPLRPEKDCPRLFVSHRKKDESRALRIAWLAKQAGWDYWIDVLDPNLAMLRRKENLAKLTDEQVILATASVVEIALLNCSHLIMVLTEETRGSMWVPYEYGRVKEPALLTSQCCCWRHPKVADSDCPEYLVFGKTHFYEDDIQKWLNWEMMQWRVSTPVRCAEGANAAWKGALPGPLPKPKDGGDVAEKHADAGEPTIIHEPGHVVIGGVWLPIRDWSDKQQ